MKVVRFLVMVATLLLSCLALSGCGLIAAGGGLSGSLVGPQASSVVANNYVSPIGLPTISVQVRASDSNPTGISQICISESSTSCSSINWQAYSPTVSFTLNPVSGTHNVFVWLKDGAGNVGGPFPAANNVVLDFSNLPEVNITAPSVTANYAAGSTIPITWACLDTDPLASSPVTITYTADDGITFSPPIASNQPSAGTFMWTIPATAYNSVAITTSTPLRIMVSCSSLAGVATSQYAPVLNTGTSQWTVFMGDPEYLLQNINSLLADTSVTIPSVTADNQNNIYYSKNNAIMVVNHNTSLVSTFAGNVSASGCSMVNGSISTSATMTNPVILGMDSTLTNLLVLSSNCSSPGWWPIFSINTSTNAVTLMATLGAANGITNNGFNGSGAFYLTKNRIFVWHTSNGYTYTLDISSAGHSPVIVHGNGAVTSTPYAVGTDVTSQPWFCASCGSGSNNDAVVWANDDASKIWISFYTSTYGYRIDSSGGGHYVIGVANLGFNAASGSSRCTRTEFNSYIYCTSRYGLNIFTYDPSTPGAGGFLSQIGTIPFVNSNGAGGLGLGSSLSNLLADYSLGNIDLVTPSLTTPWSSIIIAGQPLTTMGDSPANPINRVGVGFLNPLDLHYDATHGYLWVSSNTDIRKVDFTNSYSTSTFFTSLGTDQGQYNINMNIAGTKFGSLSQYCGSEDGSIFTYSVGVTSMTSSSTFLGGTCGGSPIDQPYPPAGSYTVASSGLHPYIYLGGGGGWMDFLFTRPVYHSTGKILFSAYLQGSSPVSNVMIFSSDGTTVSTIAGLSGLGGHNAAQSGTVATSVQLTHIWQMQEIASGIYAGDILIWDGDWLRRLSFSTEFASPKIYDLYNYNTMAGAPHPAGTAFYDVIYDQTTETGGTLGTGNTYYVDSTNGVHRFVPVVAMTSATETAYSFVGTTFSGIARIALTPAGLLVLQPNKSRILAVTP